MTVEMVCEWVFIAAIHHSKNRPKQHHLAIVRWGVEAAENRTVGPGRQRREPHRWAVALPGWPVLTLSAPTLRLGQHPDPRASVRLLCSRHCTNRWALGCAVQPSRSCCQSRRSWCVTGGPACPPAPGAAHAASQTSRTGSDRTRPQARQPTESWFRTIECEPHRGQIIATTSSWLRLQCSRRREDRAN